MSSLDRVRAWLKAQIQPAPTETIYEHRVRDYETYKIGHSICGLGAGLVVGALRQYQSPTSRYRS